MVSKFIGTWKNDINKTIFTITDGIFTQSYYDNPKLFFFKGTWIAHNATKFPAQDENRIILNYTHESTDGTPEPDKMPPVEKEYKKWFFEYSQNNTLILILEGYEDVYGKSELDIYNKEDL